MQKKFYILPFLYIIIFSLVVESAVPGRITVSGTEFKVCNNTIFINGCNTPWDNWNDFGGNFDPNFWNSHYNLIHNTYKVNASRVWITCSGEVGINIDSSGYVSGATQQHWQDLDAFFQYAEDNGIYIMATLISFDHFEDAYSTYQSWRNWINSDSNIDSYINNYLMEFLNRYGNRDVLWAIDLCNEPDWSTDTEGGVIPWYRHQVYWAKAAKAIHENSEVLVTVGMGVIKYNSDANGMNGNMASDSALQAITGDPDSYLDFWSPHYYSWQDQWFGIPFYESPSSYGLTGDRPAVIGECPAKGSTNHTIQEDYENAYINGWAGVMPWTSNGVDTNGDINDMGQGTVNFYNNHPDLVFPTCNITPTETLTPTNTYTETYTETLTPTYTYTETLTSTDTYTETETPTPSGTCWQLVWSDEFDGPDIDTNNWSFDIGGDGWGNNELEYYTDRPENARIENGNLVIEAREESYGGRNYTSARLKTQNKVHYTYGKIEARIKLPYGQGIWPAFWMLGENISSVGWPACGEIDIMEMIGGGENRDDTCYGTAHWDAGGHASYGGSIELPDPQIFADDYHIFTVEWDQNEIRWYLDGAQYHTIDITPADLSEFHSDFFIILNIAVGGNWPGPPDNSTVFPQKMYVDWVRWYQLCNSSPTFTPTETPTSIPYSAVLIDDFEDGEFNINNQNGTWTEWAEESSNILREITNDTMDNSAYSGKISGDVVGSNYPTIGVKTLIRSDGGSVDLRNTTGLKLDTKGIKGVGTNVNFTIQLASRNINDYSYWGYVWEPNNTWETIEIPWSSFNPPVWGEGQNVTLDEVLQNVTAIQFVITTGGGDINSTGNEWYFDNIQIYDNTPTFTETLIFTPTYTYTETNTYTETFTPTGTEINTYTETLTPTNTNTYTETLTPTETPTGTFLSPTYTETYIETNTNTYTNTYTPTSTTTYTPTPTNTMQQATNTYTPTPTDTQAIATVTPTPTNTVQQATSTGTPTPTDTQAILTATSTPVYTQSDELEIVEETPVVPYPNPYRADNDLTIKFNITKNADLVVFKLYTVAGRLIVKYAVKKDLIVGENKVNIPKRYLEGLANGTYYYVILVNNGKKEIKSGIGEIIILK